MNPIAKYGSALGMILAGLLSLLVGNDIITEDTAYNIAGAIFSITGGAVVVTKWGARMPVLAWLMLAGVASTALASRGPTALFVESFFDEIKNASGITSFTIDQSGVTILVSANGGTLTVLDGLVCPSDPSSGITVTSSVVMDQLGFYGPKLGADTVGLIAHLTRKGAEWNQSVSWVPDSPFTGTFFSVNNSVVGFTLTNACLDYVRFDDHVSAR